MKHILKLVDLCGPELRTRRMIENLSQQLVPEDEYLFDMQGVEQISRSAADELYNIIHSGQQIAIIHVVPFVQKMLDAVTLGRFQPREHTTSNTPIIQCQTMSELSRCLMSWASDNQSATVK